jgi:hypothetical protein
MIMFSSPAPIAIDNLARNLCTAAWTMVHPRDINDE